MKWEILWIALAVLCIVYGWMVLSTASGTAFWLVWMAMGGLLLVCAVCARLHVWGRLPGILRTVVLTAVVLGIALFVFVEAQIVRAFRSSPEPGLDCVIVLGAQMRASGPSTVLRYRLDAAAAYLQENEDTLCVVSGGQGPNEPCTEAEGMRDYLLSRRIDGKRILLEAGSGNTKENIEFSKKVLAEALGAPSADDPAVLGLRIGVVTNNFHVYRGCAIARKAGFAHVSPIPAGSTPLFLPNNMLREFLGVVKDLLAGNI